MKVSMSEYSLWMKRSKPILTWLLLSGLAFAENAPKEAQQLAQSGTRDHSADAASKPHDNTFVIGNDDVLAINVWKEPDISRSIPVRSDGKISLPLVGELQAGGQTPRQLEDEITK